MLKKYLGIFVLSLFWVNILYAKILNIENKLSLNVPNNHTYIELKEDDIFFGEYINEFFEELEMFDPEIYIQGPNTLIDFIKSVRDGEDPMENKYIASFMKKAEKKAATSRDELKYGKWVTAEIKRTLKKAKIDFESFIFISKKKITDIDTSDLDFDFNELQSMNNAELAQATKELRSFITEEKGDNKTIVFESTWLSLKRFKLAKNEYDDLYFLGEAKMNMAINETMSLDGNFVFFATVKNNRIYAILSECLVNCSGHGKKVDKMIKPMFSTKPSIGSSSTSISSSSTSKSTNLNESNIAEQLKSLNELYKSGVLTKEEFEKAKERILN